jgi:hypothetical protein
VRTTSSVPAFDKQRLARSGDTTAMQTDFAIGARVCLYVLLSKRKSGAGHQFAQSSDVPVARLSCAREVD